MEVKKLSRKDAVLKLIIDLGGEGTRKEINEKIPDYWDLRDDDEAIEEISQKPYYWHRADSMRNVLKDTYKYLSLADNIWKITQEGMEYLKENGLCEAKVVKIRLSKEEGRLRRIALMKLLWENKDEICNKSFIYNLFSKYYPVLENERTNEKGKPKYWKAVDGAIAYLKTQNKIENPTHGVWQLTTEGEKELNPPLAEKEFYEPFKQWMSENFQCKVEICANSRRKGSYTNPDLKGSHNSTTITIEIKSSENISACLKGVVQALCYQEFSNQSYLVVPRTAESLKRLSKIAERLGIGLIVFDNTSSINPNFKIVFKAKEADIPIE